MQYMWPLEYVSHFSLFVVVFSFNNRARCAHKSMNMRILTVLTQWKQSILLLLTSVQVHMLNSDESGTKVAEFFPKWLTGRLACHLCCIGASFGWNNRRQRDGYPCQFWRTSEKMAITQTLEQWFSTFLMLKPFSIVPHVVLTPKHKIAIATS